MRGPNPRLLMLLMVFILSTVGWAWGRKLGVPVGIVGSLFGAGMGWALARAIMRNIF